jgi:hypothetical protein
MSKFSDSNYDILETYFDILKEPRTGTDNSYISGQNRTIVADGSLDTILYQKTEGGDFVAHKFLIQDIDGNNFKFQYRSKLSTHTDGGDIPADLAMGEEMYFRKDSFFHDWLRNNADLYEDYINPNKTFIYFGKLYPVTGEITNFNIIFDGLKDYAIDALPEHNRTDKLVALFDIFFDHAYHDIYNLTKTMWSFFDAKEVNLDHIDYLATRMNIDTDKDKLTELVLREWVDQLPYWLKRKGTYTAYKIIYKLLLANTRNKLNMYERWAEWCLKAVRRTDGFISVNAYGQGNKAHDFEDHHIMEYYNQAPTGGAGPFYYDQYDYTDYPTYADVAPTATCVSLARNCRTHIDFGDWAGADAQTVLTQGRYQLQVDGFDPSLGTDLYYTGSNSTSGNENFRHCLTVNMPSAALPSGGAFVWAVANDFETDIDSFTGDWLGVTYELNNGTRRFRAWEDYDLPSAGGASSNLHAVDSSASYNADQYYYLGVEKIKSPSVSALEVSVYPDSRRLQSNKIETLKLTLGKNSLYPYVYALNYQQAAVSASWTVDIEDLYLRAQVQNAVATSGYKVLTPHYKVEIDLSTEPMGEDFIISEDLMDELIRYWAYIKPISKFVHYHQLLSPIGKIDEIAESVSLYNRALTAICDTRFVGADILSPAASALPSAAGDLYEKTYVHNEPIGKTTWLVQHDLDSKDVIIQSWNRDNKVFYPQYQLQYDNDLSKLFWTTAVRGTAFAAGIKSWNTVWNNTLSGAASAWNIVHNMGSSGASGVIWELFDKNYETTFIPDSATKIDFNTFKFTFTEPASGIALLRDSDYHHIQSSANTLWQIQHNLDARGIILQAYDNNGNFIYPSDIINRNYNLAQVRFAEATAGTAEIITFQREFTEADVFTSLWGDGTLTNIGSWKIGDGANDYYDPIIATDLESVIASGGIERVTETELTPSGYFLVNFSVPSHTEYTLNEIGLFDPTDNMIFYTRCSDLHKPAGVQLDILYRIAKI